MAALDFVISIPLWFLYKPDGAEFQFATVMEWIPSVGVQYIFGVDGFAVLLILLTTLLGLIAIYSSYTAITERQKEYYIFLLLLQTGMLGVFCSLDFILFYVFWEVMLVPMYFLIGVWGGPRRLYAAIKFFLYTLVGSVLMLVGILTLYFYNAGGLAAIGLQGLGNEADILGDSAVLHCTDDPAGGPVLGLPRLLCRLCHQGPDVPIPHLVARRPRRGADGRFGDSGRPSS